MTTPATDQRLHILVVKLTSMGDTLHVLPALSDLSENCPQVQIDWMIEDSFRDIPHLHPSVNRVIPVSTRRWRSLNLRNLKELYRFIKLLRAEPYDVVIDAQGLMKSAALAYLAKLKRNGKRIGFSAGSIKERPAARFYHHDIDIAKNQHAIDRLRQLFAYGFNYPVPTTKPNYSINALKPSTQGADKQELPTVFFFPSTTWASKHIPNAIWRTLSDLVLEQGYQIKISWGSTDEKIRAEEIADQRSAIHVLPKLALSELASQISTASGAIAVDTGLGHLAAGLGIATVSVYGATDAKLTGAIGDSSNLLQTDYPCSPCFLKQCDKLTQAQTTPPCYASITAESIWASLSEQMI
jgi:heptosyltransferase-1